MRVFREILDFFSLLFVDDFSSESTLAVLRGLIVAHGATLEIGFVDKLFRNVLNRLRLRSHFYLFSILSI